VTEQLDIREVLGAMRRRTIDYLETEGLHR
jgi:hypothetical protein